MKKNADSEADEKKALEKEKKESTPKSPRKKKSKKEREKEGRSIGPILLVITILFSYLIILFSR